MESVIYLVVGLGIILLIGMGLGALIGLFAKGISKLTGRSVRVTIGRKSFLHRSESEEKILTNQLESLGSMNWFDDYIQKSKYCETNPVIDSYYGEINFEKIYEDSLFASKELNNNNIASILKQHTVLLDVITKKLPEIIEKGKVYLEKLEVILNLYKTIINV